MAIYSNQTPSASGFSENQTKLTYRCPVCRAPLRTGNTPLVCSRGAECGWSQGLNNRVAELVRS